MQLAQQEWEAAKAEEAAAFRALRIVGTPGEESTYTLLAPLGGIVTQRSGSIGALVDLEESLFEIVDPSSRFGEMIPNSGGMLREVLGRAIGPSLPEQDQVTGSAGGTPKSA